MPVLDALEEESPDVRGEELEVWPCVMFCPGALVCEGVFWGVFVGVWVYRRVVSDDFTDG